MIPALEALAAKRAKALPKKLGGLTKELLALRKQAQAKPNDKAAADKLADKQAEIDAAKKGVSALRGAVPRLKLKRVEELRKAKLFATAKTEIAALVKQRPRDIVAQLEQARVLHDEADQSTQKWLPCAKAGMTLRRRLQVFLVQSPSLWPFFWEALYFETSGRYGLAMTGTASKRVKRLRTARDGVFRFKKLDDKMGGTPLKDDLLRLEIKLVEAVAQADPNASFIQPKRTGKKIVNEKISADVLLTSLKKEYERWKQANK